MAFAMMSGIIAKGLVSADNIIASDHLPKALQNISQKLGVKTTADNAEVVKASDIFILAVKPQYYAGVIEEIAPFVTPAQVVVTIAPGQTIAPKRACFISRAPCPSCPHPRPRSGRHRCLAKMSL
jgi:pyrroline-5-carboxylate reductase